MVHIPIFRSPKESTEIYIVCGRIAIYWGPVEQSIEGVLLRLRHIIKRGTADPFPVSFSRKVSEIKLHLKSSPKFSDVQCELLPILARCKWIHDIRTNVVHSICQGTNLKGKVMFDLPDRNRGPGDKIKPQVQYSHKELEATAIEMLHLPEKLTAIFNQLSNPALR